MTTLPKPERKRMIKPVTPKELEGITDPVPPPQDDASLAKELDRALKAGGGSEEPPPPSFADAEKAALTELVSMGFEVEKARKALSECGGSVQVATEKLLGGA